MGVDGRRESLNLMTWLLDQPPILLAFSADERTFDGQRFGFSTLQNFDSKA